MGPLQLSEWLESQLGLPPWLIVLVIHPVIVLASAFLLRELVLMLARRREQSPERRALWRRMSLYVTLIVGVVGVGIAWRARLGWALEDLRDQSGVQVDQLRQYLEASINAIVASAILLFVLFTARKLRHALGKWLDGWADRIEGVKFQRVTLFAPQRMHTAAAVALRIAWAALVFLAFYIYLPLLLSFFPATRPYAQQAIPYLTGPPKLFGRAILDYLPNFVILVLILVAVYYLMKLVRFIMRAIEEGNIRVPGFDPEWASQTYRLMRILVALLTVVLVYPYLPGSGSDLFRGFSIFVGALFTFGSTAAINNIISGIVLTYTGAFRVGERVRIGPTIGDVIEKKLFVTRIRTIGGEEVTVPNGVVLGAEVVNLSAAAKMDGLTVRVKAGVGYDVDWRMVHKLMKDAARATERIEAIPEPFVMQTELDDYAVSYLLMAKTMDPQRQVFTESDLRRNVLDAFNKAGVEIMTPSVSAHRDANSAAIPESFNPQPLRSPGIRLSPVNMPGWLRGPVASDSPG